MNLNLKLNFTTRVYCRICIPESILPRCSPRYLQPLSRRMPRTTLEAVRVSYEMRVAIRERPEILLQTLLVIVLDLNDL